MFARCSAFRPSSRRRAISTGRIAPWCSMPTDQVFDAEAYKSLVVAYKNGAPVRIGDLGTVIDGAEDIKEAAWLQDKRTIIIDVHKQPGFNVVETIQRIKDRLPAL